MGWGGTVGGIGAQVRRPAGRRPPPGGHTHDGLQLGRQLRRAQLGNQVLELLDGHIVGQALVVGGGQVLCQRLGLSMRQPGQCHHPAACAEATQQ